MRENVLIFVLVMFKVGFFIKEIDQIFICLKVIVVWKYNWIWVYLLIQVLEFATSKEMEAQKNRK
jgi:hypothetical protein